MRIRFLISSLIILCSCSSTENISQEPVDNNTDIYFPPINSDEWETASISELNWNTSELQPLLNYLEDKKSKSFIMLHRGKMVVEAYFNGHSAISPWYWASAGKTLTTSITGIAQDENLLTLDDKVSDYLGEGWTSISSDKEQLITNRNLLTMTSGLDDFSENIDTENLNYVADAGERWAYHGVYVKLQDVVSEASNQSWDNYFSSKLKNKIGMSGAWIPMGLANVYWSNTRSMARFGLLTSANGKWEDEQIIPETYLQDATSTSQNLNEAYGYMWWLNGKSTYMLPQSQFLFQGKLIPNAPDDMYCALGKNDQKIYVVPSKDLVIIRMGNPADDDNFALSDFDNQLWEKINALIN